MKEKEKQEIKRRKERKNNEIKKERTRKIIEPMKGVKIERKKKSRATD